MSGLEDLGLPVSRAAVARQWITNNISCESQLRTYSCASGQEIVLMILSEIESIRNFSHIYFFTCLTQEIDYI